MDKATFNTVKAEFLENLLNNILSEVEYYEQRIHICFDWEKFYVYWTESKNSFDIWVNYIASLDLRITEDIVPCSEPFEQILEGDVILKDIIKSRNLNFKEIKDNIKKLMKHKDIEPDTITRKLIETFPWFNTIQCEYEKILYTNYVKDNMWYKWFSLWEYIEEAIEKVKNLTYEEAMKDL